MNEIISNPSSFFIINKHPKKYLINSYSCDKNYFHNNVEMNKNLYLYTQKNFLNSIPPYISYSNNYHYDVFNHGKANQPSKVFLWIDFIDDVESFVLEDSMKIYEKPIDVPFSNVPVENKIDIIKAFELQIIRMLETVFNSTANINRNNNNRASNLKFKKMESYTGCNLIDWKIIDNSDADERGVIAVLALRSKRVLSMNDKNSIMNSYYAKTNDFYENVNEVYDFMMKLNASYGILSTYEYTWFIKKITDENSGKSNIFISNTLKYDSTNPTILHSRF
ncbi:12585_t:CDS:2 [Entrophospora sp. SA101]|nr:12585_t:CDS:2 [Entrophospora sp. SA101]